MEHDFGVNGWRLKFNEGIWAICGTSFTGKINHVWNKSLRTLFDVWKWGEHDFWNLNDVWTRFRDICMMKSIYKERVEQCVEYDFIIFGRYVLIEMWESGENSFIL